MMVHFISRALAVVLAIAAVPVIAALQSSRCPLPASPPSYTFIGGGFHMQLALEYPLAATDVRFNFDIPKSFFIDEAEAEQLYRMEVLSGDPMAQGIDAVVMADITRAYTSLCISSQYFFDIEAPAFNVNYTSNHVELTFQERSDDDAGRVMENYLSEGSAREEAPFRARLVIPIHSRYDVLNATRTFSLRRFITGEDSYVRRCLTKVDVTGRADPRCPAGTYSASATVASLEGRPSYKTCLDLPVGLLDDLPYVYYALMSLLVAGAVIVITAIR
ncbi:hypothetical protein LSCM1_08021 [Leishmania martiniquensis]|uniref:GPI-anchored surface protein n=1 Tax=Leishmania martiniquensis TaxID=1580590 RepID=A0A836HMD1_9TRYP|nr:hypothetical protein LSCM1_08021 [Leishmania martiniquensis]